MKTDVLSKALARKTKSARQKQYDILDIAPEKIIGLFLAIRTLLLKYKIAVLVDGKSFLDEDENVLNEIIL